jgi:hypothetical protein
MRRLAVLALMAGLGSGCTHLQLERSTVHQVDTISDVQYRMVLDNLAMQARNPGALPFFGLASQGQTQITDAGSTTDMAMMNAFLHNIWAGSYNVMASRNIQENWTFAPVTDPDKLRHMRCAYQLVLGPQPCACDDCLNQLETFFCADQCKRDKEGLVTDPAACGHCLECALPRAWFGIGKKKNVPRKACYVGHYCDTYAWVMPEGVDGLTRFTIAILDLATTTSHVNTATVKRTYRDHTLVMTEVTTNEPPPPDLPDLANAPRRIKERQMPLTIPNIVPSVPRP